MGLCGEHIQECVWRAYTLCISYLTRFRTYTIALPPKTKPRMGGGIRHIRPSPFAGQFLRKADI
jgi:hypothetical protein